MIFSEELVEDPSKWQAEKIEDDILREMVEHDKSKLIHTWKERVFIWLQLHASLWCCIQECHDLSCLDG